MRRYFIYAVYLNTIANVITVLNKVQIYITVIQENQLK